MSGNGYSSLDARENVRRSIFDILVPSFYGFLDPKRKSRKSSKRIMARVGRLKAGRKEHIIIKALLESVPQSFPFTFKDDKDRTIGCVKDYSHARRSR